MRTLSARIVVNTLNRYIVGQNDAKRAVAVALRNRWRRKQLHESVRSEVTPKNILLVSQSIGFLFFPLHVCAKFLCAFSEVVFIRLTDLHPLTTGPTHAMVQHFCCIKLGWPHRLRQDRDRSPPRHPSWITVH